MSLNSHWFQNGRLSKLEERKNSLFYYSLCFKFESTSKKMLQGFRSDLHVKGSIVLHNFKKISKSDDIRMRKANLGQILLCTKSNFHKIRLLKKCSKTSDGISIMFFSQPFSTWSQFFISTTSCSKMENVIFELKLNEQLLYTFK